MSEDNILEKVIKSQEDQKLVDLNPQELVNFLLRDLSQREQEVINARYGLDRIDRQTLESIGKKYGITRERVRQIENHGLKKALRVEGAEEKLTSLLNLTLKLINRSGWVYAENYLLEDLLESSQNKEINKNCLIFIFTKFLDKYIEPVNIVHTERAWRIKDKDLSHLETLVEGIKDILVKKNKSLKLIDLMNEIDKNILTEEIQGIKEKIEDWKVAVESYLEISKHFQKNIFGEWGISGWRSVTPKRMRDKIYLVLLKYKEPLHYKVVAEKINNEGFDSKKAHPATIHNELILDDRFVLIGRGIYALGEWGYRPGVIADVVKDVLKEAKRPLDKDEIAMEVLKHRRVKAGSINLTLSDKNMFKKLSDGKYILKESVVA